MSEVMRAKLVPPQIGGELIERPRLIELIARNPEAKLIAITAPAGYGKTISVLQHIKSLASPFVWYQLDQYDNDPAVFMQYLLTGLRAHLPGFGAEVCQLAPQGRIVSALRFIVIAITNGLTDLAGGQLTLVFDDYHVIANSSIHQFMEELVTHLPAGVRIVITSRTPPALPLSRWQVRGAAEPIGRESLRFTPAEVKEFLAKRAVSASQQWIDALTARTDGWPAALKLLSGTAPGREIASPAKETQCLYDYLTDEILDQQTEDIRHFLLSTAVLETMTPEVCDQILERDDSERILDHLEKQQLFLIPLAGPEKAYRYHQLFRDFLLERLGPRRKSLLRKAGETAFADGNMDQAVEYYLASGFDRSVSPLLEKAGKEAFRRGRWQTVERWLGMLSGEQISADEWFCFFEAQIEIYQGKLDEAEVWLSRALAGFCARQETIGVAECQFLQARILNGHGKNQEALTLLEKANPVLQAESRLRFDLPLEMAFALSRVGRFQEANQLLSQSLQAAETQTDHWILPYLLEGLGNTYYWLGEHAKALECYQKGIRISPDQNLPSYNFQDFIASIYQEWGEFDAAYEYAQRSVAYKGNLGMIEALPSACYQLAGIYVDRGEFEKAEECYRRGISLAENGGERHFLSLNRAYLSRCLCLQGRLADALALADQVLADAQAQSETLLAVCQVLCAPAFLQSGDIPKARNMLLEAVPSLEQWGFAVPLSYGYGTMAVLSFKMGNPQQAGALASKMLELTARKHLIRPFLMIPEYRIILRHGLENDLEVPFIQRILVRMQERGLKILAEIMNHPDPKVKTRAIPPLSQIGSPAAAVLLRSLHSVPDRGVREALTQYANPSGDSDLPLMRIHMLGPARIILGGIDLSNWRLAKSRDLLLYLCHRGGSTDINRILEDLWPELPQGKAKDNFYSALYWLRKTLQKVVPGELVTYAAKTYQLLPGVYATDRDRFISLINTGTGELKASGRDVQAIEEAVALYQGDYLSQLDYAWIIPEREHLKRLYLETVIRLAGFYHQNLDDLKIVALLTPLAEQNPLREEICRLLMSAYARLGDKLAVIRQYQRLRANLMEELGLEPALEIKRLYYELCGAETGPASG